MKSGIEGKAWKFYCEGLKSLQSREFAMSQKQLETALALYREIQYEKGEAAVLTNLGVTYSEVRRYDLAFDALERAITLHDKGKNTEGLAKTLFSYASISAECGRFFRASANFRRAAELLEEVGEPSLAQQAESSAAMIEKESPTGLDDSSKEDYDRNMELLITGMSEGELHMQMDKPKLATQFLNQAVVGAVALGRRESEAIARNMLGIAYFQEGNSNEGIIELKKAESIAIILCNEDLLGVILNNLGGAYSDFGWHEMAVQYFKRAIEVRSNLADRFKVTDTRINLGCAYAKSGQPGKALQAFETARGELIDTKKAYLIPTLDQFIKDVQSGKRFDRSIIRKIGVESQNIAELLSRARVLQDQEDYGEASALYQQASDLLDHAPALEAELLIACGYCQQRAGRSSKALLSYHQALSSARQAQSVELEARALNNLGAVYASTDTKAALSYLNQALVLRERLQDSHELGETYLSIAHLLDDGDAQDYLLRALDLISPTRSSTAWVAAYRRIKKILPESIANQKLRAYQETARSLGVELDSLTYKNLKDYHELITFGNDSWGFIVEAPGADHRLPDFKWQVRRAKAEVLWKMDKRKEAVDELKLTLEEIEHLREATTLPEQRRNSFADAWGVYDQLVSWLNEADQSIEALQAIERIKMRELNTTLSRLDYVSADAPPTLRAEHRAAILECQRTQRQIEALQKDSAAASPEYIKGAWRMHYEAAANFKSTQEKIAPFITEDLGEKPYSTADGDSIVASVRSDDHAFVIYWLGTQLHGAFLVTHSGIQFFPLHSACDGNVIEPYQRCLKELSATGLTEDVCATFNDLMDQYEKMFFAHIRDSLRRQGTRKVTIIPHYNLHLLPIHCFGRTGVTVIDEFVVDYAPSISILRACRRRRTNLKLQRPLIVSDPDGSLAYARLEGSIVRHFFPSAMLVGTGEATVEVLRHEALSSGVLHFACHGSFGTDDNKIGLRVSASQNHDGNMTLDEIMGALHLQPGALVVLSACNSGRTLLGRMDDYVGLPAALLIAGASTVVCTLWPVDDFSTCVLMWKFYKNLGAGMQAVAALRESQLWLRDVNACEVQHTIESWNSLAGLKRSDLAAIKERLRVLGDPPFSNPLHWGGFFCMGVGDVTVQDLKVLGE